MRPALLVFTKTSDYRHESIEAGVAALSSLAQFSVDATEDSAVFTRAGLAAYRAVVFLNTSGDVLDAGQQASLEAYVRGGGGFVGVHCAAATEYDWPFYGALIGAYFDRHPQVQPATVRIEDSTHPATVGLPESWTRIDEWYDLRTNPRMQVHVLAALVEESYEGGGMGSDHPWAWCHSNLGGRAFYTAGGHTPQSYVDPYFLSHLAGGLTWVCR